MGLDTEEGRIFLRCQGRVIRHLEKHQGISMDYHYLDADTGREFDVRDLPAYFLGPDRDDVLAGDDLAHKRVIRRAIKAGSDFRRARS